MPRRYRCSLAATAADIDDVDVIEQQTLADDVRSRNCGTPGKQCGEAADYGSARFSMAVALDRLPDLVSATR